MRNFPTSLLYLFGNVPMISMSFEALVQCETLRCTKIVCAATIDLYTQLSVVRDYAKLNSGTSINGVGDIFS